MPIRNVIFDLGGVLLEWSPESVLNRCYDSAECREQVRAAMFGHRDWHEFDRGTFSEQELLARVQSRCGRSMAELSRVMDTVRDSLSEKTDTVNLLRSLHARGLSLYCLSNMPACTFAYVRQRHAFWHLFKGIVVSGQVRLAKPERAIFEHLLSTYSIAAEETVFVDDHPPNILGSREVGIDAILFSDAQQCRVELEARLQREA